MTLQSTGLDQYFDTQAKGIVVGNRNLRLEWELESTTLHRNLMREWQTELISSLLCSSSSPAPLSPPYHGRRRKEKDLGNHDAEQGAVVMGYSSRGKRLKTSGV